MLGARRRGSPTAPMLLRLAMTKPAQAPPPSRKRGQAAPAKAHADPGSEVVHHDGQPRPGAERTTARKITKPDKGAYSRIGGGSLSRGKATPSSGPVTPSISSASPAASPRPSTSQTLPSARTIRCRIS